MGKSPGKWIKTVLFGKKSSKSTISKDVTIERKASFSAKAPPSDLAVNPPPVLDQAPQTTDTTQDTTQDNTEFKNGVDNLSSSKISSLHGMQVAADSDELNRQCQAATMAQAAFRGYLARRAFWALKGIIRLQALVRGHLVRRQAVATLQCVQAIVKFQGLVRGRIVRLSDIGRGVFNKLGEPSDKHVDMLGVNTFLISMKQSTNPFIRKLLASSPTVMPLSLRYDLVEPNSAWNWLDRWSLSSFWVPVARPKKVVDAKPKRKKGNMQTGEIEPARLKRGVRKVPAINNDGISLHSSDFEKPKRNPRKVPIHQTESEDQPQSELEKVKRNLRKVSLSASLPSDKPEAAIIDIPQPNQRKLSGGSPTPDGSEQVVDNNTSEKLSDSPPQPLAMNKAHEDSPPQPLAMNKAHEVLCDNDPSGVELHSLQNGGKVEKGPTVNEDQSYKEDRTNSKENQRTRRRSLPVKQDYPKSVSQNTPNLPSYMQATESAKAKLRAQEIQKIGDDEAENGFTRRHSLPASNVKMSTPSPRLQKPLQANGKGGSKSNRSLTSSRDEKFLQAGWRR